MTGLASCNLSGAMLASGDSQKEVRGEAMLHHEKERGLSIQEGTAASAEGSDSHR